MHLPHQHESTSQQHSHPMCMFCYLDTRLLLHTAMSLELLQITSR
uniref:Uncharacterized protein n=1 Tax=Rhizophora mucronata TaxID=61149 RepID=A0A2P2NWU1_RHIMU